MSKIMLDLETLGTGSNSCLLSIGAVAIVESGSGQDVGFHIDPETFLVNIDLQSCLDAGMQVEGGTFYWWMAQEESARKALTLGVAPLKEALGKFNRWYSSVSGGEVWGNGSMFDNTILGNAYRAVGVEQPWKFWDDRCYRTLKSIHKDVPFARLGVHHNALDDARSQAEHLIAIFNSKGE